MNSHSNKQTQSSKIPSKTARQSESAGRVADMGHQATGKAQSASSSMGMHGQMNSGHSEKQMGGSHAMSTGKQHGQNCASKSGQNCDQKSC